MRWGRAAREAVIRNLSSPAAEGASATQENALRWLEEEPHEESTRAAPRARIGSGPRRRACPRLPDRRNRDRLEHRGAAPAAASGIFRLRLRSHTHSDGCDRGCLAPSAPSGAYAWTGAPVSNGVPPDDMADCDAELTQAGVTFRSSPLPVHHEKGAVCGASQVVQFRRGPGGIAYDQPPLLSCRMALALASF